MTTKLTSVFERTGRLAAALTVCLSLAQGYCWLSPPRDIRACGQRSGAGHQHRPKAYVSARTGSIADLVEAWPKVRSASRAVLPFSKQQTASVEMRV